MFGMGRHAAPGDDEPDSDAAEAEAEPPAGTSDVLLDERTADSRPTPRGRHARPDDDEDVVTGEAEADTETPRKHRGATAADLRLLRADPALRKRVIAAVLAPFLVYLLVLLVIGQVGAFAVWVWLPLITAGVGVGVLLDAAHAKATTDDQPS